MFPAALVANQFESEAYEQLLAWKGAVLLRQRLAHAVRAIDGGEGKQLWRDLQAVATQLASASRATPPPEQMEQWRQQLAEVTKQKEQLEAALSQQSNDFRAVRLQTKLTPDQLRQIMPDKTALIDLLQVGRWVNEKQKDGSIKRLVKIAWRRSSFAPISKS